MTNSKKRRRRSSKPKSKYVEPENKAITPIVVDEKDQEDEIDFSRVYSPSGVARLNALPDYREILKEGFINNLIAEVSVMKEAELRVRIKDKDITAIERMVYGQMIEGMKHGVSKDAHTITKYVTEQLQGKNTQKIELTGAGGGALKVESVEDKRKRMDALVDSMSKKEYEAFKKAHAVIQKIQSNHESDEE